MEKLPKSIKMPSGRQIPVFGVVKDFHFRDLRNTVGPALMVILPKDEGQWSIFIKISGVNQQEIIRRITKAHSDYTDGLPFEYTFADDAIRQWYLKEERTAKMIGYLSVLAVVISIMGILAMATFYIQQRVKEIGIRKVNGATERGIVRMLNADLIKWVVIAFIVACPIAYYASMKWLQNFPYKTSISWWVFLTSGLIALVFALITVSWQSWRAASRNPLEALKYE